jgi:hypothetical protein
MAQQSPGSAYDAPGHDTKGVTLMPRNPTIPRTCQQCGTEFLIYPSRLKTRSPQYCSPTCYRKFTTRPLADRFWEKVIKTDSCWLWDGGKDAGGYGKFSYGASGTCRAHRFAWSLENGPIPDEMIVCHSCDTPACVRPDHLFLGTTLDNIADKIAKGRQARTPRTSEDCIFTKLTQHDVAQIRDRYKADGKTAKILATEFGVTPRTIYKVASRQTWRK